MSFFRPTALALLNNIQHSPELVHIPNKHWPLSSSTYPKSRTLRISVLDASFNPPTLAHLALANAPRPTAEPEDTHTDYDAKLLLLSVRNADKSLKPGDATHIQRLEMMTLLTQHIHPANVAIAIIDEPTFVGKSTRLLQFLKQRLDDTLSSQPNNIHLQLSFLVGLDTLERLVEPRYYTSQTAMLSSLRQFFSPSADNSIVVCAHRNTSSPAPNGDKLALAEEFIKAGRILMINIGEEESGYSSTAVRTAITQLGLGEENQKQWRKFVPDNVADYIVREGLYTG